MISSKQKSFSLLALTSVLASSINAEVIEKEKEVLSLNTSERAEGGKLNLTSSSRYFETRTSSVLLHEGVSFTVGGAYLFSNYTLLETDITPTSLQTSGSTKTKKTAEQKKGAFLLVSGSYTSQINKLVNLGVRLEGDYDFSDTNLSGVALRLVGNFEISKIFASAEIGPHYCIDSKSTSLSAQFAIRFVLNELNFSAGIPFKFYFNDINKEIKDLEKEVLDTQRLIGEKKVLDNQLGFFLKLEFLI
jgi:hypothetical protein